MQEPVVGFSFKSVNSSMLIKLSSKEEYLESILNGKIRFSKLSKYKNYENKNIGDSKEGIDEITYKRDLISATFYNPLLPTPDHKIELLNSMSDECFISTSPLYENLYIACFSHFRLENLKNNKIVEDKILKEKEWKYTLFFLNTDEFLNNIKAACNEYNIQSWAGLVRYHNYSKSINNLNVFDKSEEFKHQREFRIAITYNGEPCEKIRKIDDSTIELSIDKKNCLGFIMPTKATRKFKLYEKYEEVSNEK